MTETPTESATPPEGIGRLVRWPRPGSKGGPGALTFVDDPELVRALDQLGAAMGDLYHRAGGGAGARRAAPGSAGRKLLAVCRELSLLAAFLAGVGSEEPAPAALVELAAKKAKELQQMVAELEAAGARDNAGAT